MTNEEFLEAFGQLIDDKIGKKLADHEECLLKSITVLLENNVLKPLSLIAEDLKAIREQLPKSEEKL